jgi:sec-independent protein translocase protein TatA
MPRIGPWELVIILAIVMIIFGVGKLPQVGGSIGKAMREFRKGQTDDSGEATEAVADAKKD